MIATVFMAFYTSSDTRLGVVKVALLREACFCGWIIWRRIEGLSTVYYQHMRIVLTVCFCAHRVQTAP